MDHAAYLKKLRLAKGHQSPAKLSTYAKTRGHSITGQAIRNFEVGRVPNKESREVLKDILHMNAESALRFEYMCAQSTANREFAELDIMLVTPLNRASIVRRIADICELSREQRKEVELCLMSANSIVRKST